MGIKGSQPNKRVSGFPPYNLQHLKWQAISACSCRPKQSTALGGVPDFAVAILDEFSPA